MNNASQLEVQEKCEEVKTPFRSTKGLSSHATFTSMVARTLMLTGGVLIEFPGLDGQCASIFACVFVRYAYSGHHQRLLDAMMSKQKLRKKVLSYKLLINIMRSCVTS